MAATIAQANSSFAGLEAQLERVNNLFEVVARSLADIVRYLTTIAQSLQQITSHVEPYFLPSIYRVAMVLPLCLLVIPLLRWLANQPKVAHWAWQTHFRQENRWSRYLGHIVRRFAKQPSTIEQIELTDEAPTQETPAIAAATTTSDLIQQLTSQLAAVEAQASSTMVMDSALEKAQAKCLE